MTKETLAAQLTGRAIGHELSRQDAQQAREAGLVVEYGASDDLLELRGAIDDELSAWEGTSALLTQEGVFDDDACTQGCVYFQAAKALAEAQGRLLHALWNVDGIAWRYDTRIPHATFEILEEGHPYCRGIVFALADVEAR